jgi:Domain of unknown function (DUF4279)
MNTSNKHFFSEYDDAYPTCERTYATLCIYLPDQCNPGTITNILGIKPTRIQIKGEVHQGAVKQWPSAWFLSSEGCIESKDVRRHVDWLIEHLASKEGIIHKLQAMGSKISISCYWLSSKGNGGPALSPITMRRLAELEIEIWFDVYFDDITDPQNQ